MHRLTQIAAAIADLQAGLAACRAAVGDAARPDAQAVAMAASIERARVCADELAGNIAVALAAASRCELARRRRPHARRRQESRPGTRRRAGPERTDVA